MIYGKKNEIISRKGFKTKTYKLNKSYYKTVLSAKPMHYKDTNGDFKEIKKADNQEKKLKLAIEQMQSNLSSLAKTNGWKATSGAGAYSKFKYKEVTIKEVWDDSVWIYDTTSSIEYGYGYNDGILIGQQNVSVMPEVDDNDTLLTEENWRAVLSWSISDFISGVIIDSLGLKIEYRTALAYNWPVEFRSMGNHTITENPESSDYSSIANGDLITTLDIADDGLYNESWQETYTSGNFYSGFMDCWNNGYTYYTIGSKHETEDYPDDQNQSDDTHLNNGYISIYYHNEEAVLVNQRKGQPSSNLGGTLSLDNLNGHTDHLDTSSGSSVSIFIGDNYDVWTHNKSLSDGSTPVYFHDWGHNAKYTTVNSSFDMDQEYNKLNANFDSQTEITIQSDMSEILFKDPWYIENPNDSPENWNQPDEYRTISPGNYDVFLDQTISSGHYYSIKAPYPSFFDDWTGTNVTITDPNSPTTDVVFHGSNSTIKANYNFTYSSNKTWNSNVSVPANQTVTVASGATLTINAGKTIDFGQGAKLLINGTLSAQGSSSYPIIFTSTSGDWYGIVFDSGSSGLVQNSQVKNSDYGIKCKSDSPDVLDNTFSSNNYALYIYNSSPDIESNKITNDLVYLNNSDSYMDDNYISNSSGSYCLKIYSSSPTIFNHTITGSTSPGISVDNGSNAYFGSGGYRGYNDLYNNGSNWTVIANNASNAVLGTGTYAGPYWCGYNTITAGRDALGEAWASSNSQVDAKWCWWGQATPPNLGSNVTTDYALSSDPGGGSSLAKQVLADGKVDSEYIVDLPVHAKADSLWNVAMHYYKMKNRSAAVPIFKSIIRQYPELHYAYKSLFRLERLGKEKKDIDNIKIIRGLQKDVGNSGVGLAIKNRLISNDRSKKDFKAAVIKLNEIIEQYPDTEHEYYALYDLFNIYQKDLKNDLDANNVLTELKDKYAGRELTLIAQFDNGETIEGFVSDFQSFPKITNNPKDRNRKSKSIVPENFSLLQNYPNPFNPTTTITYGVPEESSVKISIYNMNGRLVETLVNSHKTKGYHKTVWNASNVPSGVYFYRINAGNYISVKKCILMK